MIENLQNIWILHFSSTLVPLAIVQIVDLAQPDTLSQSRARRHKDSIHLFVVGVEPDERGTRGLPLSSQPEGRGAQPPRA